MYGAKYGINLSANPESVQEGVGATSVTVRAVNVAGQNLDVPLVVPFEFKNVTMTWRV